MKAACYVDLLQIGEKGGCRFVDSAGNVCYIGRILEGKGDNSMKSGFLHCKALFARVLTLVLCMVVVLGAALPAAAASPHWEKVTIRTSYGDMKVSAYVLGTPAKSCKSFDLDVEIEMMYNAKVENWDIWIRSGGKFTNVGTLSLPGGTGSASKTVRLSSAKDFDAVALTPTKGGGYSWSLSMAVSIPDGTETPKETTAPDDDDDGGIDFLPGDYEKVSIQNGRSSINTYALVLEKPLRSVKSFGVAVDVEMQNNTSCKDWDVYIRTGGSFTKVGQLYLEDGDGFGYAIVELKTAQSFDAVAVIPTKIGGYSWMSSIGVFNAE